MKEYQEAAFSNWQGRRESMCTIFKRLLAVADEMNPIDAVLLSHTVCTDMITALGELENYHRQKQTEDLLSNVFNSK
jgi:hypothetical protein